MAEENETKQGISTQTNATGGTSPTTFPRWNKLPNELRHQVIVHAVTDPDKWRANKTLVAVLGTSHRLNALARSEALQQYKVNLDGGRRVSDAVIETAFPGMALSDDSSWWSPRHSGHEAAALTPALEFQSPEMRSDIFNKISAKDAERRMSGYLNIADRADLFQKHESLPRHAGLRHDGGDPIPRQ